MSENKQQPPENIAKPCLKDHENDTMHKERQHMNKNVKPKTKQRYILDKNILDKYGHDTEVIKIIKKDLDLATVLMDIEVILRCFDRVPILFCLGELYIHLKYDKLIYADVLSNVHAKTVPFQSLVDICNLYQTFVVVGSDRDKVHVLPKTSMTYLLFDKLGILQKSKHSKVSVEFKDLLPIYYRAKRKQRKNISGISTAEQRKHDLKLNDIETISIQGKRHINACSKCRLRKRQTCFQKTISPRITRRLRIAKQYPVEDELFNFPIQVTSDDLNNENDEQVPSAVTPSLYFANNQSFSSSLTVSSNNASSRQINFHTHDSSRHPTDFHITNSSSRPTDFHTNNLSSRPTSVHTNNLSSQLSNLHVNDSSSVALNRPTVPPRYEEYVNYRERFASYEGWPYQRPTSTQLSEAGFFFTNDGDLVRCFQCGIGLKDFSQEDDPLLEHVRHSGKCPFLPQHLGEERLSSIKRHLRQTDPEYYRRMQLNGELNPDELSSYRHPEYRTREARLSTFTNWPRHMMQTPERLAEAGLYYIGVDDHVRCFACDGGLRRWDPEDDPWTEHCRWFPACPFAIEQKGEQFIALIQASVENERFEASGGGGGNDDMVGAMERLRIRESETDKVIKQHGPICRDMGFEKIELKEAVLELNDRGNKDPSIEDIVDVIEVIRDRKQADINFELNATDESSLEENRRLKNHLFCMICEKNNTNALFLPCTHHRLCKSCAEPLQACPVCRRNIREKIRTYMV